MIIDFLSLQILQFLLLLFIGFIITWCLVPFCIALAVRLQFMDVPDGIIKRHQGSVPYLGGVAIFLGFFSSLALSYLGSLYILPSNFFWVIIGLVTLLIVGLLDDLIVMAPYQKFLAQILAVICFLQAGFYFKEQFLYSNWNIVISCLWILIIINAINLIDVMDGLATTTVFCATASFAMIAAIIGSQDLFIFAPFLGALLGFFWYNKPRARIYMGDAGALFIGGFLAVAPFLINWSSYNPYGFLIPVVVLAIPLLEIGTLIIIRTYKKIPFYLGSPDHFCMYLKNGGWEIWDILKYVIALSIILSIFSILFFLNLISLAAFCATGALFLIAWYGVLLYFSSK